MSYALLAYNASNVGDEIQSIAASRFLPSINEYIVRENIHTTRSNAKVILNAFWSGNPKNFPPSNTLDALPLAMHCTLNLRKKATSKVFDWFKKNEPIGCRDLSTLQWLKQNGIDAYFSGCLTLTLQCSERLKRRNHILCVDMPEAAVKHIQSKTDREVLSLTRITNQYMLPHEKMLLAKVFLQHYQQAHCVVSGNLHTIMPCLALKTPVLAVDTGKRDVRFTGLTDLLHQCTLDQLMNNEVDYDFTFPKENKQNYLELREKLITQAAAFTGYNSDACLFDDFNEKIELTKLFYRSKEKDTRALQFYTPAELFKGFVKRVFSSKEKRYESLVGL